MKQSIRYQGAIIRDSHILLIQHREHVTGRTYWVLPGGKREPHETEEACVRREMLEETHLDVVVEGLLLDEVGVPLGFYQRLKTYSCRTGRGEPRPGFEPEEEAAQQYAIAEARWFDLRNPSQWEAELKDSPFTLPLVHRLRVALGYAGESSTSSN